LHDICAGLGRQFVNADDDGVRGVDWFGISVKRRSDKRGKKQRRKGRYACWAMIWQSNLLQKVKC
jgi:hypothetical protein